MAGSRSPASKAGQSGIRPLKRLFHPGRRIDVASDPVPIREPGARLNIKAERGPPIKGFAGLQKHCNFYTLFTPKYPDLCEIFRSLPINLHHFQGKPVRGDNGSPICRCNPGVFARDLCVCQRLRQTGRASMNMFYVIGAVVATRLIDVSGRCPDKRRGFVMAAQSLVLFVVFLANTAGAGLSPGYLSGKESARGSPYAA